MSTWLRVAYGWQHDQCLPQCLMLRHTAQDPRSASCTDAGCSAPPNPAARSPNQRRAPEMGMNSRSFLGL